MSITILHSPFDGVSRDFLASLGVAGPTKDDDNLVVDGKPVRLISEHGRAVATCAGFGRYPALVYEADGAVHVLNGPTTWQQCLDFMAAPWGQESAPPPAARTMTKYVFRTRVLTFEERKVLDNSTIPDLVTMRTDLLSAEVVDLDEVALYKPIMLATGLASEERIDEIIAGVTHE